MNKLISIGIIFFVFLAILYWAGSISYSNSEIYLKNKIEAQKQVCGAYYDKLWKVISQKAQIAEEYKSSFKEIYPLLIQGRYGNENGGTFMKWITESNPTFDVSLYKDLMLSIEAERTGFFMEQKLLIDLHNEHKNIRETFPGSIFIGSRPDIEITIVISDVTEQVMSTGKENNVDVFNNNSK